MEVFIIAKVEGNDHKEWALHANTYSYKAGVMQV